MTPDNPGVSVRLDRAKVDRAFRLWNDKIMPFLMPGTDPAITAEFDGYMRDLHHAAVYRRDTDDNA